MAFWGASSPQDKYFPTDVGILEPQKGLLVKAESGKPL